MDLDDLQRGERASAASGRALAGGGHGRWVAGAWVAHALCGLALWGLQAEAGEAGWDAQAGLGWGVAALCGGGLSSLACAGVGAWRALRWARAWSLPLWGLASAAAAFLGWVWLYSALVFLGWA